MRKVDSRDEETLKWLAGIRWPSGISCPICKGKDHTYIKTRGFYQCNGCRKQFNVFTSTRFQATRLSPFKLASTIIYYFKESMKNYDSFQPNLKDKTIKHRWKGPIGVRALARGIGTYATAQRLHKKLSSIPFSPNMKLNKFIANLLR